MALRTEPASNGALYQLTVAHYQQGRLAEAIACARKVAASEPKHAQAHHLLGLALHRLGRRDEALASFEQAIAIEPAFAEAHGCRANVLSECARWADAIGGYDRALALRPESVIDWCGRAAALHALRRYEEAVASFDRALALAPDMAEIHCNRGNSLAALERDDDALAAYDRALAVNPALVGALNNRGNVFKKLARWKEAIASFEQALRIKPDFADAYSNLGTVLRALNREADAIRYFQTALALRPDHAEAQNNLGNALLFVDRYEEAIRHYEIAIRLRPDYADAHCGLGAALQALNRDDQAAQCYDHALALNPDQSEAKLNKSVLYLRQGRFAEGWPLYEARLDRDSQRPYSRPRWNGEHVDGTLLIWGEQGLGDEILHASMVPELRARAQSVVLEVEPRLVQLFARSFPGVQVTGRGGDLYAGRIDAHEPIGGLGKYLRTSWQAFPRRASGYLIADARLATRLRERLTSDEPFVVGLSWSSKSAKLGKSKSAQLTDFAPLLRLPNCRYVDLQYGDTAADRKAVERELGIRVDHFDDIDNMQDIDGLAALISACDLIVTVSNTTAHLAGALGKPSWVLVPYGNARLWYWFNEREISPWYPRVRVKWQSAGQSWAQLVCAVAPEISAAIHRDDVARTV